jgi:hypothetical protein
VNLGLTVQVLGAGQPLAFSREKINGYHALLQLDAQGRIAVGAAKSYYPGKPLVFTLEPSRPRQKNWCER